MREASRTLAPYAEQGEALALSGDVVTIGYRSQLLVDHMDQPQARQLVAEALTRTFGTSLRVRNRLQRDSAPATARLAEGPGQQRSRGPCCNEGIWGSAD